MIPLSFRVIKEKLKLIPTEIGSNCLMNAEQIKTFERIMSQK